jgi:hypothetical protein
MDDAVRDGAEDNDLSRDQVIEMVLNDMIHNTDVSDVSKIYLVSSKPKQISNFDTARLIKDISENLPDIKKESSSVNLLHIVKKQSERKKKQL